MMVIIEAFVIVWSMYRQLQHQQHKLTCTLIFVPAFLMNALAAKAKFGKILKLNPFICSRLFNNCDQLNRCFHVFNAQFMCFGSSIV